MTTKTMLISGLVALLIIATGILLHKPAATKPQPASPNNALPAKLTVPEPIVSTPITKPPVRKAAVATIAEAPTSDKTTLQFVLPIPVFAGTPKDIKSDNLEPARDGKSRDPLSVPTGTKLLSKNCKVTASVPEPILGELSSITDGDKEHDSTTCVELAHGVQWVQVDLGKEKELFAACVWHFHGEPRIYKDVICQASNDPDFIEGVQTVFNNDHDNSSKLGKGSDKEYFETSEGRPFPINGVKGRYVRFSSKGNTSNEMNHYTEVEIYGKDL